MAISQERPNTIFGLEAKRAELVRYRDQLEAEHRKVTCDIDHLEAALKLFDPSATPSAIKAYVVRHRARKGTVKRFILTMLRLSSEPLSSLAITEAWVLDRGLRTDTDTLIVIRKRLGAALIALRKSGLVVNSDSGGVNRLWKIASPGGVKG